VPCFDPYYVNKHQPEQVNEANQSPQIFDRDNTSAPYRPADVLYDDTKQTSTHPALEPVYGPKVQNMFKNSTPQPQTPSHPSHHPHQSFGRPDLFSANPGGNYMPIDIDPLVVEPLYSEFTPLPAAPTWSTLLPINKSDFEHAAKLGVAQCFHYKYGLNFAYRNNLPDLSRDPSVPPEQPTLREATGTGYTPDMEALARLVAADIHAVTKHYVEILASRKWDCDCMAALVSSEGVVDDPAELKRWRWYVREWGVAAWHTGVFVLQRRAMDREADKIGAMSRQEIFEYYLNSSPLIG
jgi:hypothetical protein